MLCVRGDWGRGVGRGGRGGVPGLDVVENEIFAQ